MTKDPANDGPIGDDAEPEIDAAAEGEPEEQNEVKKAVPAWIISVVVHMVVLGLLSLIITATQEVFEEPPIKTTSLPPPPKIEEKKLERDIKQTDMPLDVEVESDKPSPVTNLDVPVEEFSREEENDADVPKGREEAKADSEMGGAGAFMAIGAGGGSSGMFGSRNGGGKKRALGKFGGSKGSESAVDAALKWFKKHQSPNGQWDVDGYPANCTEAPKCEPGNGWPGAAARRRGRLPRVPLLQLAPGEDLPRGCRQHGARVHLRHRHPQGDPCRSGP
jgi:hypothetical protein